MNSFVGIGKISEVEVNGKLVKFCLGVQQEKPCRVPCVVFGPSAELIQLLQGYQERGQTVWLQGRLSSYEFEQKGRPVSRKIEVMTYANGIKPVA